MFSQSLKPQEENWVTFVNATGSITAFVDCFTEKLPDFKDIIIDLIRVCKDKTDAIRKAAAVLMAKLAKDEFETQRHRAPCS